MRLAWHQIRLCTGHTHGDCGFVHGTSALNSQPQTPKAPRYFDIFGTLPAACEALSFLTPINAPILRS